MYASYCTYYLNYNTYKNGLTLLGEITINTKHVVVVTVVHVPCMSSRLAQGRLYPDIISGRVWQISDTYQMSVQQHLFSFDWFASAQFFDIPLFFIFMYMCLSLCLSIDQVMCFFNTSIKQHSSTEYIMFEFQIGPSCI